MSEILLFCPVTAICPKTSSHSSLYLSFLTENNIIRMVASSTIDWLGQNRVIEIGQHNHDDT